VYKRQGYVGRSKNPQKLYQESKIFMMTSNFEGFGMTLTEALQNACVPFVFNTFSSLHDIIESDYNGFIIPAKDEILYATKMIEFMQGKNQDKYAVQALESSRKFSIENIGLQWIHLLNELVGYK
ncbi:glycosyltransferase, partial [Bacteroides ovatus]